MNSSFQKLLGDSLASGVSDRNINASRVWMRDVASKVNRVDTKAVIAESRASYRTTILPGRLYLFSYNPKHKDELPYYDRFPIVFPFNKVKNGFLGINMHYLPYVYRARLLDALYPLMSNDKMDETTRLKISYNILNSSSKYRFFEPSIKHYLNNHVTSRFVYIDPKDWETALFLPLQRFVGATTRQVHMDSTKKIRGIKR